MTQASSDPIEAEGSTGASLEWGLDRNSRRQYNHAPHYALALYETEGIVSRLQSVNRLKEQITITWLSN
jgi:hypothetical protein